MVAEEAADETLLAASATGSTTASLSCSASAAYTEPDSKAVADNTVVAEKRIVQA